MNEPPVAGDPEIVDPAAPLVPSTPPPGVRRERTGSRWPLWVAIGVGVVSLLCVSGLGIGYHYYDKATKPNRSAPDVVVDNYLRGFLINRSDSEAAQYTCSDQSGLAAFQDFRNDFVKREASLGGAVSFGWGPLAMTPPAGSRSDVSVTITVDTSGGRTLPGESIHNWTFNTTDKSGWQVCGATEQG